MYFILLDENVKNRGKDVMSSKFCIKRSIQSDIKFLIMSKILFLYYYSCTRCTQVKENEV